MDLALQPAESFAAFMGGICRIHRWLDLMSDVGDFDSNDKYLVYGLKPLLALMTGGLGFPFQVHSSLRCRLARHPVAGLPVCAFPVNLNVSHCYAPYFVGVCQPSIIGRPRQQQQPRPGGTAAITRVRTARRNFRRSGLCKFTCTSASANVAPPATCLFSPSRQVNGTGWP